VKQLAVGLIKLYQGTISQVTPPACRYVPSCSNYAIGAISKYGLIKGGWLTLKRIVRCNPWSEGGHDPVP
jgi:putative membrane protein insertion efficiency factor